MSHICFQWDLCQIILLFDKSNPRNYFIFTECLEMSLKFTYEHTTENTPPVQSVRTNEKSGAEASWAGRDLTCYIREEAELLLILAFPPTVSTNLEASNPFSVWHWSGNGSAKTPSLLLEMRHNSGKVENTNMFLSTRTREAMCGLISELQ